MATLVSDLGGKVGQRFADLLLSPALGFWLAGLLAWVTGHGGLTGDDNGWAALRRTWEDAAGSAKDDALTQIVVASTAVLLIAASARVVEEFTLPVLRLLEGYWPVWAEPARAWRIRRHARKLDAAAEHWRDLTRRRDQLASAEQRILARLNAARSRTPVATGDRTPTALGDVLKAMETRPRHRYGLDAVVCFPRLWHVLPDAAREDLRVTRRALDDAVRFWLWCLLLLVWTAWAWWAPVIAILGTWVAYRTALLRADGFSEVVQSCFDVYRDQFYEALGFQRPPVPADERRAGVELTAWLERGRPPTILAPRGITQPIPPVPRPGSAGPKASG